MSARIAGTPDPLCAKHQYFYSHLSFPLDSVQKIEDEAADAQTQYEAISLNWDSMLVIKDPLDIDAEMKEQKRNCDALLEQKNQLIGELKDDLKGMDLAYYEDLDKQVDKNLVEMLHLLT